MSLLSQCRARNMGQELRLLVVTKWKNLHMLFPFFPLTLITKSLDIFGPQLRLLWPLSSHFGSLK